MIQFEWPDSFRQVNAKRICRVHIIAGDIGNYVKTLPERDNPFTPWIITVEIYGKQCRDCSESPYSRSENPCTARNEKHDLIDTFIEVLTSGGETLDEALVEADRMLQDKIFEYRIA